MKYRINRKTGDRISEIGIGSSYMYEAGREEAVKALRRAVEGGINYFDLAAGHGDSFPIYGEALEPVREQIFYQIHFGADYTKGDYGFIHCHDEFSDLETYKKNGIYDYILQLKKACVVHHIGLSSHT
ncbi:MAG: aldo/keto reductase, partial [Erysipelotrichaceae bacterium]|nr:aldo/keto reductase [Erysipelotrichaceae bacterium]